MSKRNCGPGTKWDSLLQICMDYAVPRPPSPTEPALTSLVPLKNTHPADQTVAAFNPTLTSLVQLQNTHPADQTVAAFDPALTSLVKLKNMPPADQTVAAFNPALWILVLLATLGSILALALWIVIYRRHTRHQHRTAEDEPAEQPLQNTDPLVTVHTLLPSERDGGASPQHLHTGVQTAPIWEEGGGAYREQTKHDEHDGRDWGRGLKGSAVRQETVPLPATELGGTALVTTKTL